MGQIDWETTGAIGLGLLVAAGAASLGVWKTTAERNAKAVTVAAEAEAAPQRRAQARPGDDMRRMRARAQAPGAAGQPNLPPGHPPLNQPSPGNRPPSLGASPARPAPVPPMPMAPQPARPVQPVPGTPAKPPAAP